MPNPYQVLGVERDASEAEIKKAYRRLAMKVHPDKVPEEQREECNKKFQEVSHAYEILSDAEKRSNYDRFGEAGLNAGGGGGAQYMDPNDLFAQFFAGGGLDEMFGGGVGGPGFAFQSGRMGGATFHFSSSGFGPGMRFTTGGDPFLGGRRGGRTRTYEVRCTLDELYSGCQKTVRMSNGHEATIQVQPGWEDRQQVSASGLELIIREQPHAHYDRDGTTLHRDVGVGLVSWFAGGVVEFVHLDNRKIRLKFPGFPLEIQRIRGKGMPDVTSPSHRGDLTVRFLPVDPSTISAVWSFAKVIGQLLLMYLVLRNPMFLMLFLVGRSLIGG